MAPLGEAVERQAIPIEPLPTQSYREIGIRSHGKGIFHKEPVTGDALGSKRVFSVVPNCLVFNIVFAWEGAVAVTSDNERGMIASHRFPMFATKPGVADPEFLRRFFQTELGVRLLGDASPGGAGRNRTLNQKFAAEIPVPLPSIGEQRKIATILSSVDAAIEAALEVIDQVRAVKQAMMAELLTHGLPGRHARFEQTEIGKIPSEWSAVRIADVLEDSAYGTSAKCDTHCEGCPVLRIPNVVTERVTTDSLKYAKFSPAEIDAFRLRPGDLLVIRTNGNPAYVGRSAVVPDLAGDWLFASYLIRLRVRRDRMTPGFLHEAMRSEAARKTMQGSIRTSAGNYNLNTQGIANTVIPVPALDEQEEIVAGARVMDARQDHEERHLVALRAARNALMSVLLTGEVRVKPDEEAA